MQLATDSQVGFLAMLGLIVKDEGSAALFRGLKPALLRQASYQSVKMFLYEPIRDAVLKATTPEGQEDAEPQLWQMIIAGGVAGGIGTFLTSPTDLIKVRMQSGVKYDGVVDACLQIVSTSGVLSLWDGWAPNVQVRDGFGRLRMASDGFGWLRIASDGFRWLRDGFGLLLKRGIAVERIGIPFSAVQHLVHRSL